MKNLLPQKITGRQIAKALSGAKASANKLLPQSGQRRALQLPIPQTPFDHYRRRKLVKLLRFNELVPYRSVLEVGCGIGDLLLEIHKYQPRELYGVDGSKEDIELARQYLENVAVDVSVANARSLPFPEKAFDVVFVMFELQHILDENQMQRVVQEACRVSRQWVVLVEDTAPTAMKKRGYIRRPVGEYKDVFRKEKFHLRRAEMMDIAASKYIFTGGSNPWHWIRWLFSPLLYLMGFPQSLMKPPTGENELPTSRLALFLQKLSLPLVTGLDDIVKTGVGTTVMRFERERLFGRG
ncbi:MAG: class I SAM-dependent methyltransferase [Saprospiraceae bacterium]